MNLNTKTSRDLRSLTACAALALTCVGVAGAFPMQDAVAAAGTEAVAPAPVQAEELRAIFIDVAGKVQWRASETAPWQEAVESDVVQAGAEIRTGFRSRAALRVGMNATILLESVTTISLPAVLQEGDVLRTTAVVRSGRADFKVDRVGLANDFRVVTPSTTLAVKGTEFAVMIGPLKQVEIVGARTNIINAIELRYALNNRTVNLSGAAQSSSGVQNPTHLAMLSTAAPSADSKSATSTSEEVKEAAQGAAPVKAGAAASAGQSNNSSLRTAAQNGELEMSVSAKVSRSIQLANERTALAIEYMIHAGDASSAAVAQSGVLASLRELANARRGEALAMLSAHQAALSNTQAGLAGSLQAQAAFNSYAGQLANHLNTFGAQRQNATDLLGQIESAIQDDGKGQGDLRELAQQATDALMGMNTALENANSSYQNISAQLALVNQLLSGVDTVSRPQAAAAIASYHAAMAQLQQLAANGASATQIAAAAQSAVANLEGLISNLADLAYTHEALAAASQAMQALAQANAALAQSQASLDAIRAAHDAALAAGNGANFGMVEQLYQQIVAIRTAMANSLLASAGLIDSANDEGESSNSYAEGVFTLLGNYWRDAASDGNEVAGTGAQAAMLAAGEAAAAQADHAAAVLGAEGVLAGAEANFDNVLAASAGVSQAHADLNQSADSAMSALAAILNGGDPAINQALMALDALEQALGAIVGQYGNFQNVAGQQIGGSEVAGFQAQGAAALQALLDAIANAQQASASAAGGAASANSAAEAAAAVRDLALQLAERFGLNMDGALAAAAQAYAEAIAAGGSAGSAESYAQQAQALALLAHADAIGNIAAQIDALLAQTGNLSAAALAELNAAQGSYVAVNEYGTSIFASLTQNEASGAYDLNQGIQPSMSSLQEMASTSTAYVAALDGAETAAQGAESAERGASAARDATMRFASYTDSMYGRTATAAANKDYASAVVYSNNAGDGASSAAGSAGSAANYAQQAVGYYDVAQQHGQAADALQAIINSYGSNSAEYQAAAAAYAGDVQGANAAMQEFSARADFYNDVAQMLAGRANTDPALAAAVASGDSHAQVVAIAAQLAASAQNAAQLEQTARTNAERMFYRSARQYVERAGTAAQRALDHSSQAQSLAQKAAEQAAQAANLAGQGGGD